MSTLNCDLDTCRLNAESTYSVLYCHANYNRRGEVHGVESNKCVVYHRDILLGCLEETTQTWLIGIEKLHIYEIYHILNRIVIILNLLFVAIQLNTALVKCWDTADSDQLWCSTSSNTRCAKQSCLIVYSYILCEIIFLNNRKNTNSSLSCLYTCH